MQVRLLVCVVLALAGAACAEAPEQGSSPAASGPPRVQSEVVARHAAQFDQAIPKRPAGSQQEATAATYILGHLQVAGYAVRLDSVPVRDLVSSTNVVALPPGGRAPKVVVAVAYDDATGGARLADDIGLFLEAARALRSAGAGHSVAFVALGAQDTEVGGGRLGSRRLVRLLLERDEDPVIVSLSGAGDSGEVCSSPPEPSRLGGVEDLARLPRCEPAIDDPFLDAPLPHIAVGGPPEALGEQLLAALAPAEG